MRTKLTLSGQIVIKIESKTQNASYWFMILPCQQRQSGRMVTNDPDSSAAAAT